MKHNPWQGPRRVSRHSFYCVLRTRVLGPLSAILICRYPLYHPPLLTRLNFIPSCVSTSHWTCPVPTVESSRNRCHQSLRRGHFPVILPRLPSLSHLLSRFRDLDPVRTVQLTGVLGVNWCPPTRSSLISLNSNLFIGMQFNTSWLKEFEVTDAFRGSLEHFGVRN